MTTCACMLLLAHCALPHWELSGKLRIAAHGRIWHIFILYVLSVQNPESTRKVLQTQLKKGNSRLEELAMDTLDLSMMKKMAADLEVQKKETWSYSYNLRG